MALFTGKGDNGTTLLFSKKDGRAKTFGCDQRRISKSSSVAAALGSLDEINSFLGLCKIKAREKGFTVSGLKSNGEELKFEVLVHDLQKSLFIVQAELAGAPKTITEGKVKEMEEQINFIEKIMPPIKTFFISGGSELAALFDVARTLSRRAERRVVAAREEGVVKIGDFTGAYLNRLSSMLYALARLSNHLSNIKEEAPDYK